MEGSGLRVGEEGRAGRAEDGRAEDGRVSGGIKGWHRPLRYIRIPCLRPNELAETSASLGRLCPPGLLINCAIASLSD